MKTKEQYDKYLITSMVAGFEPIEVAAASNTQITGTDGKSYLDCFSGIAVVNAGHGHPRVIAAAKAQIDKLIHCCTYVYYSPRAGELAQKLAEITPGALQKSFFGNGGAEAIEGALRIAKQHTKAYEIVALTQSFHGRTNATLSITGNRARKKGGGPYLPGISFTPAPYAYRCPFGSKDDKECAWKSAEFLRHVLKYQTGGKVAAFIAEPILGEGGILVPHEDYFKYVKQILKEEDILFIADEVQTGFGRTGKLFAIEHYGVEPDIMTMAKGIADGFPLSAFIVRPDIAQAFTPGDHLSTFGGNPVSCAAALANIDVLIQEKLVENAAKRGQQLMARLRKTQEACRLVGDVRGKGLMVGIELVKDAQKTPAAEQAKAVRWMCLEKGMLVGLGGSLANVIRLQPPLTMNEAEIERVADVLDSVLKEITKTI